MSCLSLLAVTIFSLALQAQTSTVNEVHGTKVNAELTKRIDTKKAKVGDLVEAKTMIAVKLEDGTDLPKGTRLVGKVTEVRAKSNSDKTSHLAIKMEQAATKDGHEVPLQAMLTSVSAPVDEPPDTSAIAGGSRAGGGAVVTSPNGSSVNNPTETYDKQAIIKGSMQPNAGDPRVARGPNDRVPVGNLQGAVLTAEDGTSSSGAVDSANGNIMLDSMTKITLRIVVKQK